MAINDSVTTTILETHPHPWYGNCDALMSGGQCYECNREYTEGLARMIDDTDGGKHHPSCQCKACSPQSIVDDCSEFFVRTDPQIIERLERIEAKLDKLIGRTE